MQRMIASGVVSVLLGGGTGIAAQLPPEIMVNRYLLGVEQAVRDGDFTGTRATINKILDLQKEHTLDLAAGGREGRHCVETPKLMNKALAGAEELKEQRKRELKKIRAALERNILTAIEFVPIPAGEFRMGFTRSGAFDDEQPVTQVRISRAFYLGKYEVTQGQWEAVMGSNPSKFKNCGLDCPVESVSWDDVQAFIAKLNEMEGGPRYRLPTEAEWEYAARAGSTWGGRVANLDAIAWYSENSKDRTHPVGGKVPNAFGSHDMLGNVWEWVQDWYGDYPGGAVTDPRGPGSGSYRVRRGGGWLTHAGLCRSAYRFINPPDNRSFLLGFRLLRTVP